MLGTGTYSNPLATRRPLPPAAAPAAATPARAGLPAGLDAWAVLRACSGCAESSCGLTELARVAPQHLPASRLLPVRLLGEGLSGRVWLARWRGERPAHLPAEVAVKQQLQASLLEDQQAHHAVRELRCLARLRHPCIVPLLGADLDAEHVYTVMPAVAGGTLATLLADPAAYGCATGAGCGEDGAGLPEPVARFLVACIMDALAHCHAEGVAFRDLKPENVLIGAAAGEAGGLTGAQPPPSGGEGCWDQRDGYPVLCDFMFSLGGCTGACHAHASTEAGGMRKSAVGECASSGELEGPSAFHGVRAAFPASMAAAAADLSEQVAQGAVRPCCHSALVQHSAARCCPARFHDVASSAVHALLTTVAAAADDVAHAVEGRDVAAPAPEVTGEGAVRPRRATSLLGTPSYMAPELQAACSRSASPQDDLPGEDADAGTYDPLAADVWSLGVLACELLTGALPVACNLREGSQWGYELLPPGLAATCPPAAAFVAQCLAPPAHRLRLASARQVEWLASTEWEALRKGHFRAPLSCGAGAVAAAAHRPLQPPPQAFGKATYFSLRSDDSSSEDGGEGGQCAPIFLEWLGRSTY